MTATETDTGASRKRAGADEDAQAAVKRAKAQQQVLRVYQRAWQVCEFTYEDLCNRKAEEGVAEEQLAAAWERLARRAKDGELELAEELFEDVEWYNMPHDGLIEAVEYVLDADDDESEGPDDTLSSLVKWPFADPHADESEEDASSAEEASEDE